MKKLLSAVALLGVASTGMLNANSGEFRSPLRVIRGVMHWPLERVEDAWWYDNMPEGRETCAWAVDTWGAAFTRFASEAFDPRKDSSTTKTQSLSSLWFGKDAFRGEEIFTNGIVTNPELLYTTNPFLGFARITPRFDYNERGVVAGVHVSRTFGENDRWRTGFRVSLPVKEIEIEHDSSCKLEETLDDVVRLVPFNVSDNANPIATDFAYRLDFLSSLYAPVIKQDNTLENLPIVDYGYNNTGFANPMLETQIAGQNVEASSANESLILPPVYVIRADSTNVANNSSDSSCNSCDDDRDCSTCPAFSNIATTGQIPLPPFRQKASQVTGALNADGSGGTNGSVLFFKRGNNYEDGLAKNRDAQTTLFVVPRLNDAGDAFAGQPTRAIFDQVQNLANLGLFEESASEFFRVRGIDLCAHDHVVGVGDLDFEWSIGYGYDTEWFVDYLVGMRFPTGTKQGSAKNIYHKPTGNNRHFEIKLGFEGGWQPCDWFAFRIDASYNHAFKRTECRAAPFCRTVNKDGSCTSVRCDDDCNDNKCNDNKCNDNKCNTNNSCSTKNKCDDDCNTTCCPLYVKNIGSSVEVDISWDYFVGHLDFTIFHPHNHDLGMVFGYQLMAKGRDKVDRDCDNKCSNNNTKTTNPATATDLLGRANQPLDYALLGYHTKAMTHKLYGDIFHRWNYFELYGGASHIVAGRHAMQETEAHLGMKVYF